VALGFLVQGSVVPGAREEQTWMSKHTYLAFDLGVESGRALIGRFEAGVLSVEEIHRSANEPVRYNGELHWDEARFWWEMQRAMSLAAASNAAKLDGIGLESVK
jgi:sugar (pentulose or hexulose) kinase